MKNRFTLRKKINSLFSSKLDKEDFFEELEELLILSDISTELTMSIIRYVKKESGIFFNAEKFTRSLKGEIKRIFTDIPQSKLNLNSEKNVILIVGVNGSGKTTQVAKIGKYLSNQGGKVLFAAADTFRAAGSTQLSLWGDRLQIPVIGGAQGADPGSVVYNSLQSLQSKDYNVLLIDTAGRVQTKDSLMKELRKLTTIIQKFFPGQPAETLLVVDATMGNNTLEQARKFKEFAELTGLVLAKLDGSAKGGTVINIVHEMRLPVKFAGIGETENDLIEFNPGEFVEALFAG
jgi:fused signal recognition particle receptor